MSHLDKTKLLIQIKYPLKTYKKINILRTKLIR